MILFKKPAKLKTVKVRVIDRIEEIVFVNVTSVGVTSTRLQINKPGKEYNFFTHSVKWYTIEDE